MPNINVEINDSDLNNSPITINVYLIVADEEKPQQQNTKSIKEIIDLLQLANKKASQK